MTCRDAIEVLADFLEQTLPGDIAEMLDEHLGDCPPCRAYLKTYDKTRGLVGLVGREDMPPEMKTRLRAFLLAQLTPPAAPRPLDS